MANGESNGRKLPEWAQKLLLSCLFGILGAGSGITIYSFGSGRAIGQYQEKQEAMGKTLEAHDLILQKLSQIAVENHTLIITLQKQQEETHGELEDHKNLTWQEDNYPTKNKKKTR